MGQVFTLTGNMGRTDDAVSAAMAFIVRPSSTKTIPSHHLLEHEEMALESQETTTMFTSLSSRLVFESVLVLVQGTGSDNANE